MIATPRLKIDRMNIAMPGGMQSRANAISRLIANQLAKMPLSRDLRIARLSIPAVTATPAEGDRSIAVRVAQRIHAQIQASESDRS